MKIFYRLFQEFWLPALLAFCWTVYNIMSSPSNWDLKTIINIFGPSFFLVSWATGQFFRVRKQMTLDKNISTIETRVDSLLEKLDKHTKDFMGYTTGSDSVAYFIPMIGQHETVDLGLFNQSSYPVFDVQAELIDLDESIDISKGKLWTRHTFNLQSLFPNRIIIGAFRLDMKERDRLYLNIFINARNQGTIQKLRILRVNGSIQIASQTRIGEKIIEQKVPDDFPGWNPDKPNDLFN